MNAPLTPLEQEAANRAVQEREAAGDRRRRAIAKHRERWRTNINGAVDRLREAIVAVQTGDLEGATRQAQEGLRRISDARVHRTAFEILEETAL